MVKRNLRSRGIRDVDGVSSQVEHCPKVTRGEGSGAEPRSQLPNHNNCLGIIEQNLRHLMPCPAPVRFVKSRKTYGERSLRSRRIDGKSDCERATPSASWRCAKEVTHRLLRESSPKYRCLCEIWDDTPSDPRRYPVARHDLFHPSRKDF